MSVNEKTKHIIAELKGHAPFTFLGAVLGIAFMLLFQKTAGNQSRTLFAIFHPAHVILSAMVTASMFKIHTVRKHILLILLIGYFGSIGIATLSDIVIPHIGSSLLGLDVPTHAQTHTRQIDESHNHAEHAGRETESIHLAFIEEWYIVNPAALAGILIAFLLPRTKFPHAAHVLISTWASSAYLLMNLKADITIAVAAGIFVTLFIATWLPYCISDIIFPLLFVKSDLEVTAPCSVHDRHSHPHIHKRK